MDSYDDGYGVPVDKDEAMRWLQMAADLDQRSAQNNMARKLRSTDLEKSQWYQIKAGQGGNAAAQSDIADGYKMETYGFAKDERLAEKWYHTAIDSGSLDAMFMYAWLLETKDNATDADKELANNYYKRAVALNYLPAFKPLADNYYVGCGVEENDVEAERVYRKFIDIYDQAKAEGVSKLWYPTGQGSCSTLDLADKSWREVIAKVCENLAWLYRYSKVVEHDKQEADRLEAIAKVVKPGEEWTQKGNDYYYGNNGVKQNYEEAVKWYKESGTKDAQTALNEIYSKNLLRRWVKIIQFKFGSLK